VDIGKGKKFSLLLNVRTGSEGQPAFHSIGLGVVSPKVKRPGREVDHSPPLNVSNEVKNEWTYKVIHPIRLHGMDRDSSPFNLCYFQHHTWFQHYLNSCTALVLTSY
jgi:hypothetical protein